MSIRRAKARSAKRTRAPSSRAGKDVQASAVEAALAGIAHDIRTPLTGIVALAELLASSDLGAREREWADAIKSGADHLAALSTLIVDAAKANVRGLVVRNEPFSPRVLAEVVGATLAARASNKALAADVRIAADLPAMVSGDVLRLRAALENLADNAVKFTDAGTVLFTADAETAARRRMRLVFTFTDSGIGMSAGELKKLFRPFAQGSAEIAKRYGGAGLGISFVERLAKAMGGDLEVTSRKGHGSTFRLTVLVDHADLNPSSERTQGPAVAARPLSILCAEDNPYGRVVMNTILRELGHRVDFVETGEAAIDAVTRGAYDAVLMDVTLSGLGGLEATRRIRALPGKVGQTPVVAISGHDGVGDAQAARTAGVNHYFVKPVSPAKLAQVLARLG
jgi:two-component system, sensor histidine kinase